MTTFIEDDRCAGAVDPVLLDVRANADPIATLRRWPWETPVGLGAMGTWVTASTSGLLHRQSPESQARYLETHLTAEVHPATAVFVYRWRDQAGFTPTSGVANGGDDAIGLHTADGSPRPAYAVVRGVYTGEQRDFAFAAGAAPEKRTPWVLLCGWLAFGLIGSCFASSVRLRNTLSRYFLGKGFYRESMRSGREVLLTSSVMLPIAQSLCAGVTGSLFVDTMRHEAAFQYLLGVLPEAADPILVTLLARPWMLVMLLGGLYAIGLNLWTTALTIASGMFRRIQAAGGVYDCPSSALALSRAYGRGHGGALPFAVRRGKRDVHHRRAMDPGGAHRDDPGLARLRVHGVAARIASRGDRPHQPATCAFGDGRHRHVGRPGHHASLAILLALAHPDVRRIHDAAASELWSKRAQVLSAKAMKGSLACSQLKCSAKGVAIR